MNNCYQHIGGDTPSFRAELDQPKLIGPHHKMVIWIGLVVMLATSACSNTSIPIIGLHDGVGPSSQFCQKAISFSAAQKKLPPITTPSDIPNETASQSMQASLSYFRTLLLSLQIRVELLSQVVSVSPSDIRPYIDKVFSGAKQSLEAFGAYTSKIATLVRKLANTKNYRGIHAPAPPANSADSSAIVAGEVTTIYVKDHCHISVGNMQ